MRQRNEVTQSLSIASILFVVTLSHGIPQDYGPPQSSQQQEPKPSYGPPGFTPGEPVGSGGGCMNTDLKRNEQFVMSFYQDEIGDKRMDLVDMYLAPNYINHNPFSSGPGREDFKKLLQGPLQMIPQQKINFKRVNAVGDVVWTHSSWRFGETTFAAMDIFRINCDGQIEEHWDVTQDINAQPTMNPQAFF